MKERGYTLLGMLVALGLLSLILLLVMASINHLIRNQYLLQKELGALDQMVEAEDFLRKELGRLQFVPYCPAMLPDFHNMYIGSELSFEYQDNLYRSIVVSLPEFVHENSVLDLWALRGSGGAGYKPILPKDISGIVRGSSVLQVRGLLPVDLYLEDSFLMGDLTAELVGVRNVVFYLTDCRASAAVKAKREGNFFELGSVDKKMVSEVLDLQRLQVYVVKEYLIYVKVEKNKSNLVVDFLDGQAFLRIPDFVDLRAELMSEGVLSIGLLLAKPSLGIVMESFVKEGEYIRKLRNFDVLEYRRLLIGLGND